MLSEASSKWKMSISGEKTEDVQFCITDLYQPQLKCPFSKNAVCLGLNTPSLFVKRGISEAHLPSVNKDICTLVIRLKYRLSKQAHSMR